MAPLRWGIVSAGNISHDFVTSISILPAGLHEVKAVAARDLNRAKEFAKLHNIPNAYGSYEELAKSDIDVAYVGSLNPQHYDHVKLLFEHGKNVLCEKPLCLNLKQTKELVEIAHAKNLFFMEAIWSRMFPVYAKLKEEIETGNLGEVLYAEATFGLKIDDIDRIRKKEQGGGSILDLGVYILQFAQFVFEEEPIKVTATGVLNEDGVDQSTSIILTYSKNRVAVLSTHTKLELPNVARVMGTKGTVTLDNPFWCPEKIQTVDGKWHEYLTPKAKLPFNFVNSGGLSYEAEEVRKCIQSGLKESSKVPLSTSLTLAKLEDTVRSQIGSRFDVDS